MSSPRPTAWWCVVLALLRTQFVDAQVVLDGTLGTAGPLAGPDYLVTSDLGQVTSGNLFHSFNNFNLAAGESATFSGPATVSNILARVTGGAPSQIDGLIRSTIVGANLFLINPNGIVFGLGSDLDVSGSFVATTANVVHLADGGMFHASIPGDSVLTSAAPSAFGFMPEPGATPSAITAQGRLKVVEEQSLSLVGGELVIDGGEFFVPAGQINFVGVGSVGEVAIEGDLAEATLPVSPMTERADVTLTNGALVQLNGALHAGGMAIRGQNLIIDFSIITSLSPFGAPGKVFEIDLGGDLSMRSGLVSMSVVGLDQVPDINVSARDIEIDGLDSGVSSGLLTVFGGDATGGAISIQARSLTLAGGALISTASVGNHPGGAITIDLSGDLQISGTSTASRIAAVTLVGPGGGGDVTITADTLRLQGQATVVTETQGPGSGGSVSITADQVLLSGTGAVGVVPFFEDAVLRSDLTLGLVAIAETSLISAATRGAGPAGDVHIDTRLLDLFDGSFISAAAFDRGDSGQITIQADSISIEGGPMGFSSVISSSTLLPVDGGDAVGVEIYGGELDIGVGAILSGDTFGSGNGGDMVIEVDRLHIDGGGSERLTAISVNTNALMGAGDGGNVSITIGELELKNRAGISAATSGNGLGGRIEINADRMTLDGQGNHAAIIAAALGTGAGGSISVNVDQLEFFEGGFLSATSLTAAAPGNVDVVAGDILIDGRGNTPAVGGGAFLITGIAAEASDAMPGDMVRAEVSVTADSLRITGGGTITTATTGSRAGGDITVSVGGTLDLVGLGSIVAVTSETGKGGDVTVSAGALSATGEGTSDLVPRLVIPLPVFDPESGGVDVLRLADSAFISATSEGPGDAGSVKVWAQTLDLFDGATISANTFGSGRGGSVDIDAGAITAARGPTGFVTGVFAATTQNPDGGDAGDITMAADTIDWRSGAIASVGTLGSGASGNLIVSAERLVFDGEGTGLTTQFSASTLALMNGGPGGNMTVTADEMILRGGGMDASALGDGAGGRIDVLAGRLVIDGDGLFAAISTSGFSTGSGGDIRVQAADIVMTNRGIIAAAAVRAADAGSVEVVADTILIEGNGVPFQIGDAFLLTGITAEALERDGIGGGTSGEVRVTADHVRVTRNGAISTAATGVGSGGNIIIDTATLEVAQGGVIATTSTGIGRAGDLTIRASDFIRLTDGGTIATSAVMSSGGNVTLEAANYLSLDHSTISATALQDGGNIDIDPLFVILNSSDIIATAILGNGGNISIAAGVFLQSADSVVDASSQLGVSGNVQIDSPTNDLAGSLAPLPEGLIDHSARLTEACAARLRGPVSSFTENGQGGTPIEPVGRLPSQLLPPASHHRETASPKSD